MITSPQRPDRRRAMRIALALSIVVNLLVGSLVTYVYGVDRVARLLHLKPPDKMSELVTMSSAIRIEKRKKSVPVPTVAHSAVPHPPPPPPVAAAPPKPVAKPVETPRPVRHARRELAKISPHHAPVPRPIDDQPAERLEPAVPPVRPKIVAKAALPSRIAEQHVTVPTVMHRAFSSSQLASLDTQFRKTIAQAQAAAAPIRPQKASPITVKHYTMQFQGIHDGLSPGEGYIQPISHKQIGNTVWYYTHYEYMNADGSVEQDDIPWPFHYPVDGDLFARGVRWIPLQPPPPGFVLTRPLKPQLQQFFPKLYPASTASGTGYGAGAGQ